MVAIQSLLVQFFCLSSIVIPSALASPRIQKDVEKRSISRDSEPGLMGSGTYPRAATRADGTIVSCFTTFSGSNTILTVASSSNGGWDWTVIGSVATEPTQTHDLDNCNVLVLPSGRILAAFRHHDQTAAGNNSWYYYRLVVCYSDNGGAGWTYLSTPIVSGTAGLGLWEPFLQNSLSGTVRMYFSQETKVDGSNQNNYVMTSSDGGLTWGGSTLVSSSGSTGRDGMVGVARLGAGSSNLIAVFETMSPVAGIHAVTSSNDGASWGNRSLVYLSSVSGASEAAPQIAYINGQLVVSFQTNEDNTAAATSQWSVKVVVSTDNGGSWGQKTTVLNACNWAGELTVDATHLLVMCGSGSNALAQTMLLS